MKPISLTLTIAGLFGLAITSRGQNERPEDPLAKHLAPPSFIINKAQDIGLTSAQGEKIKSVAHGAHLDIEEPKNRLALAYEGLAAALSRPPVDEAVALEKLDLILELERTIKRRHLQMLIAANGELRPEQQTKLRSLMRPQQRREPAEVTEKRLKGKIEQLKGIAEGLAAEGQSPNQIHEMMKVFTAHMEKGQVDQAEELLDATLDKLRGDESPAPDGASIDPDSLKREIEAMRVKDVAWREIEWKTCLLDGLMASREQKKPMVLWVFIDRPVDDKRC